MAVNGVSRYARLWRHIANPSEYVLHKKDRHRRDFLFTTRPLPIRFRVPNSLYLVFKEIFMSDVYEIDRLVAQLPSQPVILDIGANAGFFAVQLLSKIERAAIYAYEPVPANVATLRQTMYDNERLQQCVQLHELAVTGSQQSNVVLFTEAEENSQVVASAIAGFNANNTRQITVPCITLTEIIQQNNLKTIDLLKLDCEGSEYDIIYQTDPTLIRRITRLTVEVHNLDTDRNNVVAFAMYLQSLGYRVDYEPIQAGCYALSAYNP